MRSRRNNGQMSLHRSLKTKPAALNQHRNVLTRAERIAQLKEEGRFTEGEDSPLYLVKVGNRQVITKKEKKKKPEDELATEGAVAEVETD